MKNDLESKVVLQVYEFVQKHGEQYKLGKQYEGIHAFSDIDGYTIYLEGNGVLLTFGFHNKYSLDYEHDSLKNEFMKKLAFIMKQL